jgi:hypothetical protein
MPMAHIRLRVKPGLYCLKEELEGLLSRLGFSVEVAEKYGTLLPLLYLPCPPLIISP